MTDAPRQALIQFISDESRSPMAILGAAVSFVRMQKGSHHERIADAVDLAIQNEIQAIKTEQREGAQ